MRPAHAKQVTHNETQFINRSAIEILGRWCPWEILIWISHGDPRAMAPMGNPLQCQLWFGSNGETHVKSRKGDLTMIFPQKSARQHTYEYQDSGQTGLNAGIICNSNQGKGNSATERKPRPKPLQKQISKKKGAADWNAASKAAAAEGGFSQSNGQAASEKQSSQNYVSTK